MRSLLGTVASGRAGSGNVARLGGSVSLGSSTDTNTYTSTTFTPNVSGNLVLLSFVHSKGSSPEDLTSIVSASLSSITKLTTVLFGTIAAPLNKLELWCAVSTSTADTVRHNLPNAHTSAIWNIAEYGGVNTATGTNGVVQTVSNRGDAGTAVTATLAAFANALNGAHATISSNDLFNVTPDTGWTEAGDRTQPTPPISLENQWRNDPDTSVAGTLSGTTDWAVIAVELAGA